MKRLVHQELESIENIKRKQNKQNQIDVLYWQNALSLFGFDNIGDLYVHCIDVDDATNRTVITSVIVDIENLIMVVNFTIWFIFYFI